MATELAIEDHHQHNQQYGYVDPITQRYRQAKQKATNLHWDYTVNIITIISKNAKTIYGYI